MSNAILQSNHLVFPHMYILIIFAEITTVAAVSITVTVTIVTIIVIVFIFKIFQSRKSKKPIYDVPYYAMPELPARVRIQRIDSGIYDTIPEDCKDVNLQQADAPSQNESPNGAVSLDVVSDNRDATLNYVGDDCSEQHGVENTDHDTTTSQNSVDKDVVGAVISCVQMSFELHSGDVSGPDAVGGRLQRQSVSSDTSIVVEEIEIPVELHNNHNNISSPDQASRMLQRRSVSDTGTLIKELESSVELQSDNTSSSDEVGCSGLAQKQSISDTSTVIIKIENSEIEPSEPQSISDSGTVISGMESSPENDAGIRMVENESYQPSLVSSITLDQNSAYGTNAAIAPEIETEENIAYQHNLNVTESVTK